MLISGPPRIDVTGKTFITAAGIQTTIPKQHCKIPYTKRNGGGIELASDISVPFQYKTTHDVYAEKILLKEVLLLGGFVNCQVWLGFRLTIGFPIVKLKNKSFNLTPTEYSIGQLKVKSQFPPLLGRLFLGR